MVCSQRIGFGLACLACLASTPSAGAEREVGLQITPANAAVRPRRLLRFTALLHMEDGTVRTPARLRWGASGGSIDGNGSYVPGSAAGVFTVTAAYGKFRAMARVQVGSSGPEIARVETLPSVLTVRPGQKKQFAATAYDGWGRPVPFMPEWKLKGAGDIDKLGLFRSAGKGVTVIRAEDPRSKRFGEATVFVGDRFGPVARLEILPGLIGLLPNESARFVARAFDSKGRRIPFREHWAATGGAMRGSGLYVAGVRAGDYEVTVRDSVSGRQAKAQVKVAFSESKSSAAIEVVKWRVRFAGKMLAKPRIVIRVGSRSVRVARLFRILKGGARHEIQARPCRRNRKVTFSLDFNPSNVDWLEVGAYDGSGKLIDYARRELTRD